MKWNEFAAAAHELGFSEVGLCSARAFTREREIVKSQPEMKERKQLRFDPAADDERIRSIAVLLYPYAPYDADGEGEVFVDGYYSASNKAYHAARELEKAAAAAGRLVIANVSYPAKEAAMRAGMGIYGKNGLVITQRHGTRVVIILAATDFLPPQQEMAGRAQGCLDCGRCMNACPSGALDENGMSHPERCLRNFMMEGNVMPEYLRRANGMRLIGCDICQRVCPMQPEGRESAPQRFYLDDFMTEDSAAFSQAVARLADVIGRNAARPQRVRAQAALLAGNTGEQKYKPVLEAWKAMPYEAVAAHSEWALEQICRKEES